MKRPSDAFIGAMIGLMIGFLVPSNYMHTEADIVTWLVLFPGMGACAGTLAHILRHRRT